MFNYIVTYSLYMFEIVVILFQSFYNDTYFFELNFNFTAV